MTETRKTVTLMVVATFEGDYYDADECSGVLSTWITDTCEDRDDLRGVAVIGHHVTETPIDDREDLARQLAVAQGEAHVAERALESMSKSQKRAADRIWAWVEHAQSPDMDELVAILDRLGFERPTPRALGAP